jgi:RNA-directed DNA polymerase
MQEPHSEGVAHHTDPESCAGHRKVSGEALTGGSADQPLSCEIIETGVPTLSRYAEGNTDVTEWRKVASDPAQSKTLCMRGRSSRGKREIPQSPTGDGRVGRSEKANGRTSDMYACGKSDGLVVPEKRSNKGAGAPVLAESVEGRGPTKGNMLQTATQRTQCRESVQAGLQRVRKAARRDKEVRFTAPRHHVSTDLLRESYCALKRKAAPGVDGETWQSYGQGLEERIAGLHGRVHRGAYRAKPSRRTYIPKADGRQRPLGVAATEDKVLERAIVTVLQQIYEEYFLGFSYGSRPGRGAHDALDALWVGLMKRKVNWVLDADIRGFFDTIDHEWLMKFLEHRIADRRVLRLIRKWLKAGVLEEGPTTVSQAIGPHLRSFAGRSIGLGFVR